ncbi:hypothetical protein QZH41_002961 [Actinostola sp. cb2023]|nr:hypothetical protein QZH41_002961 [Actinostola sp. cb2023]
MQKEDLEAILRRERSCTTHCHQSIELFCQECDVLMCLLCWKDDHKNHTTMSLQEFTAFQKHCLSKNLEEIEKIRCDEKKQQEEIALKIKADGEKAKEQVKKITQKLVKTLRDHEQQLLNQIQSSITKADSNVRILRHTPAAKEYIQNIIDNGIASDMIDMQDSSKQFTYNPFKRDISGIVFDPNEDLSQQVNIGPGEVRFCWSLDPMMSTVQVDSHLEATKKAKLTVVMKTSTGEVIDELTDDNVDIQISPEDDVQVKDKQMRSGGKIEVEFIPRVAVFYTDAEYRIKTGKTVNIQNIIEQPELHFIARCGSSDSELLLYSETRPKAARSINYRPYFCYSRRKSAIEWDWERDHETDHEVAAIDVVATFCSADRRRKSSKDGEGKVM